MILSSRHWDSVGKKARRKLLSTLVQMYEIPSCRSSSNLLNTEENGSSDMKRETDENDDEKELSFDIPKLSSDMSDEICLLIPRIVSLLNMSLEKRGEVSFYYEVKSLCMLLMTNAGQELALTSPTVMVTLVRCLEYSKTPISNNPNNSQNSSEKELIAALVMIKKVCSLSDNLRKVVFKFRGMSLVSTVLQKMHWSDRIQAAGRSLLLDLSCVDGASIAALSLVCRKLLNSPQLQTKYSAIKLLTSSILHARSTVLVSVSDWEAEAEAQLTRLLLCAPLAVQYDTSEMLALLLARLDPGAGLVERLSALCGAVLCLRYTLGGGPMSAPADDWDMKFYPGYALEAPEILVCNIVSEALRHVLDDPLQLKALTGTMRSSSVHLLLMAHIFWYIRDRDIMQQIVSVWTDGNVRLQNIKLRSALRIKSFLMKRNKDRFLTPELRRASDVMCHAVNFVESKSSTQNLECSDFCNSADDVESNKSGHSKDLALNAQELSCLNAIAALHGWVQLDPEASRDIESVFERFAFSTLIRRITVKPQHFRENITVIDIIESMKNLINFVKFQPREESKAQVFSKTGFRSTYLSKLLSPGVQVKNLKNILLDALVLEGSASPALEASLDDLSSSVELSSATNTSLNAGRQSSALSCSIESVSGRVNETLTEEAGEIFVSKKVVTISDKENIEKTHSVFSEGSICVLTIPPVTVPAPIKIYGNSNRVVLNKVVPPRPPKGEMIEEGRLSRWQDDEMKHKRGKEFRSKMMEQDGGAWRSPPLQTKPSPPRGPRASTRFVRHQKNTLTSMQPSHRPPSRSMECGITDEGVDDIADRYFEGSTSVEKSVRSLISDDKPVALVTCEIPNTKSLVDDNDSFLMRIDRGEGSTDSYIDGMTYTTSKPATVCNDASSNQEKHNGNINVRDDTSTSKPQSFALQMIKELRELKERGDEITEEEAEKLRYINKVINILIDDETRVVEECLESIAAANALVITKSVSMPVRKKENTCRDPLVPLSSASRHVTNFENYDHNNFVNEELQCSKELNASYKERFAQYYVKNKDILSELAIQDF